jgi:formylglycine-generating enzyme required for sulfatase activity
MFGNGQVQDILSYTDNDIPENESRTTNRRIVRGGAWHYYASTSLRLSDRSWLSPDIANPYNGIRCVRSY